LCLIASSLDLVNEYVANLGLPGAIGALLVEAADCICNVVSTCQLWTGGFAWWRTGLYGLSTVFDCLGLFFKSLGDVLTTAQEIWIVIIQEAVSFPQGTVLTGVPACIQILLAMLRLYVALSSQPWILW
jgi:hypothetical protein